MARAVFDDQKADQETKDSDRSPLPVRRKPLIKGGAASDKYIMAAAQGGVDRTYQEISPDQIQDSQIQDRIDVNEDLPELVESIRENGQEIPIRVRIVDGDKPYEIVFGRRRLAAVRQLGLPNIKAFVTKMDDRAAFKAQGIENSARLETSFIERARAASQGQAASQTHEDIAAFLNVSRPLVTLMIKIYQSIGEDLVMKIGPARGVGRRKWESLVSLVAERKGSEISAVDLVDTSIENSVDRFSSLMDALQNVDKKPLGGKIKQVGDRKVYLDGGLSTLRKPRQLVINTSKELPPHVLDEIQLKVEEVVTNHKSNQKEK
jgi:ParB family chromosome partitioning protein